MFKLLIRLSAVSLGLSCVVCTSSSQSQLASLNERMNQMLSALYASPLLSKSPPSTSAEENTSSSPETSYIVASDLPHVVYVSPSQYLEPGAQPNDYGYPTETHPVARSAWPYPYEYAYSQYAALPRYPEAPRPAYPQIPSPVSQPPFPAPYSPLSYGPAPYPSPAPIPPSYPAPIPVPPASYQQYPAVQPQFSPVSPFSSAYLPCSSPYPLGYPAPYPVPTLPPQYPGFPTSLPGFPLGYQALPSPGFSSQGYPSPGFPSPAFAPTPYPSPAYPKYSEVLHHPFNFNKI